MYTKFKNKNPLQKHKIKIKNMGNNNLQFYKRVLMSETTQCERHSTQWKKPFAAFASLFWGNHTVREKLALKKLLHIRKKKEKRQFLFKKQPGRLVQGIKKCGRTFPYKMNKKCTHDGYLWPRKGYITKRLETIATTLKCLHLCTIGLH